MGSFSFFFRELWLTGNHPLESRGKHSEYILREIYILLYEPKGYNTYKGDYYYVGLGLY